MVSFLQISFKGKHFIIVIVLVTVFSPINGHYKTRTPLITGKTFFHWPISGQNLIKNFLKAGQVISGHSNERKLLSSRNSKFVFFSLQLADGPKFLQTGIEKMTKLNGLLSIYFKKPRNFRNFVFKLLFYSFFWP